MIYVSDFTPVMVEDEIDVESSLVEIGNTENDEKQLYTLFNVLEYSEYFRNQQVLGLVFHARDDNDIFISIFNHIKDGKTSNDELNNIVKDIEPLHLEYSKSLEEVQSEFEDYDKTIIFAPKLGYAIKLENGYIVTVNDDSFYTNLANDFHVKCDDYFKLDKDIESKWFRKQKLVHQALLKNNEDAFPPD